jgi:hypothetical protein
MRTRTWIGSGLIGAAIVLAAASQASADFIADGQFNEGPTPGPRDQYYLNYSTPIGPWQILDNNVDVIAAVNSPYGWIAPSGTCCSVDLVGYGSTGGIYQTVDLGAGKYTLSFSYGNNPYSTGGIGAAANVEIGTGSTGGADNILLTNISHNSSTDGSVSGMNWSSFAYSFTLATASDVTFSFDTTTGENNGGIALSDVTLTPVPPALSLIGGGLGLLGLLARRKKRPVSRIQIPA